MSKRTVIFTGPTLSKAEGKDILDAIYLPPAKQGDMYAAYLEYQPQAMGLIDGYFERVPAPWHKEILYIMSQGVSVYGSSSMGALRAAELAAFGMHGVGEIFDSFHKGILEDDDEVTLVHGPAEVGYPPLSEAMVNIRATFGSALERGVCSTGLHNACINLLKATGYKNRTYNLLAEDRKLQERFSKSDIKKLCLYIQNNTIDLKKIDAIKLLSTIQDNDHRNIDDHTSKEFVFQNTVYWQIMKNQIDANRRKVE